jgi:hypothetical protein
MKTTFKLSVVTAVLLFLTFGCEPAQFNSAPETIDMQLEATFLGDAISYDNSVVLSKGASVPGIPTVEDCGKGYEQMIENAQGKESNLGNLSFTSVFCFGKESILPSYSYFQTTEGDILYVYYSGKTRTKKLVENCTQPKEVCAWEVQFTILGGTGRLEGATGQGTTNDFIESQCEYGHSCHHSWKGQLTVLRKNWE